MQHSEELRRGRHVVFALHAHLVFVTKYRRNVLDGVALDHIKKTCEAVCADFGATLEEFNGEDNHVHLLVNYPPHVELSKLVNSLKGVSSRLLKRDIPRLAGRFYNGALWSPSYFVASCGGAPLSIIKQYIEQQNRPL